MSFLMNSQRFGGGGGGGGASAQATAFLNYLTAQGVGADGTRAALLTTFINGLVTDGVFAYLDVLYLLVGHADLATRVNIISPGNYTLTKVNSPAFTTDGGWNDNAGAGYLDSGFNVSSASGRLMSQNDAGLVVGCLNDVSSGFNVAGAGTTFRLAPRNSGNVTYRVNTATAANTALSVATSVGVTGVERTSSTSVAAYKGGSSLGTASTTSSAPPNNTLLVLTSDGTNFAGRQTSMVAAGKALGATLQLALRNRYVTFATALGLTPE